MRKIARKTGEQEEGELVALVVSKCCKFAISLVIFPAPPLPTALFQKQPGEVVEKITLGVRKPEFFFYNICSALGDLWVIHKLSKCKLPY